MEVPEPDGDRHLAAQVEEEGDRAGAAAGRLLQGHGLEGAEEGPGHARITNNLGFPRSSNKVEKLKKRGKYDFLTLSNASSAKQTVYSFKHVLKMYYNYGFWFPVDQYPGLPSFPA